MKNWFWYSWAYRPLMRFAHHFNWHHMTVCYPDGDKMLWCHWCGAKHIVYRAQTYEFKPLGPVEAGYAQEL